MYGNIRLWAELLKMSHQISPAICDIICDFHCSHDIILLFRNYQSPIGHSGIRVLFIMFDEFVTSVIKGLGLALIFR